MTDNKLIICVAQERLASQEGRCCMKLFIFVCLFVSESVNQCR